MLICFVFQNIVDLNIILKEIYLKEIARNISDWTKNEIIFDIYLYLEIKKQSICNANEIG